MPDTNLPPVTISGLPQANEARVEDRVEVTQDGASRSVTVGQIAAAVAAIGVGGPPGPVGPAGPTGASGPEVPQDIYAYGADGSGTATDLTALDAMLAAQVSYLPRLYIWAKTSIDVGSLIPGSDLVDPMPYIQKIFAAFDTPGMQGRHFIFGRQRAWTFLTRPGAPNLGPQNQYITPPQRCTIEWQREWDFSAYSQASNPNFFSREGSHGPALSLTGGVAKGARTVTVTPPGAAAGLTFGQRVILHNTASLTNLVGSFTLADGVEPIRASISGTTLTVTVVTNALPTLPLTASLAAGDEIGNWGSDTSVMANTKIVSQTSGTTGGIGVYQINNSHGTVASRLMWSTSGNSARAEDLIVKFVSGDVVTFEERVQNDYEAAGQPVLKTYLNEPEIRLVNPLVIGRGYPGTGGVDRMFHIRRCRNTIIEGGRISNFPEALKINSSLGGRISDLDVYGCKEDMPGGGITILDATSNFLVQNCRTWGGGQMFMLSNQGDGWGVTRDVTYKDCVANGPTDGFTTHNMHERIRYDNCQVNGARGKAFDIRVRGVTMTNCTVRGAAANSVLLRPSANDFVCDGLRVDKALHGIVFDDAATYEEVDYHPSNITIRNSLLERIGGSGSVGAMNFAYAVNNAGVFPQLGPLNLINNTITMIDNTRPIQIKGKWANPLVEGNTITGADGYHPAAGTTVIEFAAPTGGTATDGPNNPVVRRNKYSSDYGRVFLQSTVGVTIINPQEMPGVTSTSAVPLTTNTTLLETQTGGIFTNQGATGAVTTTLPIFFNNTVLRYEFYVTTAQELNIVTTNAMPIRIGAGVGTNLKSSVVGAWARLTLLSENLWIAEVDNLANWTQDWSPWVLGSDLIAWWDIANPPAGSTTVRWVSIVDRNYNLQNPAASAPTWDANAVDFTGNKWLNNNSYPTGAPTGASPSYLYASVDQTNLAAEVSQRFIAGYGTLNTNWRSIARTSSAGVNRAFGSLGATTSQTVFGNAVAFDGPHWAALTYDGALASCRMDGVPGSTPALVATTIASGRFRIGCDNTTTPTLFANMKIKRVLLIANLSAPNQTALEAWLTARV